MRVAYRMAPARGYGSRYSVTTTGRVWSHISARYLKPGTDGNGYQLVVLRKDGASRSIRVHTLVLETFVGPRPDGMEARHLDGDPANNDLTNLAWGTVSQNRRDIRRHGRNANANKTECVRGHEFNSENTYVYKGNRQCRACRRERKS